MPSARCLVVTGGLAKADSEGVNLGVVGDFPGSGVVDGDADANNFDRGANSRLLKDQISDARFISRTFAIKSFLTMNIDYQEHGDAFP